MRIGSARGIKWPSYGPARPGMRALDVTVAVDPVRVNGKDIEPGVMITGEQPPTVGRDWWPWILGAAALAVGWWLVKDDVREEGANVQRPFAG